MRLNLFIHISLCVSCLAPRYEKGASPLPWTVLCCAQLHRDPALPRERLKVQEDERQHRARTRARMSEGVLRDFYLP